MTVCICRACGKVSHSMEEAIAHAESYPEGFWQNFEKQAELDRAAAQEMRNHTRRFLELLNGAKGDGDGK